MTPSLPLTILINTASKIITAMFPDKINTATIGRECSVTKTYNSRTTNRSVRSSLPWKDMFSTLYSLGYELHPSLLLHVRYSVIPEQRRLLIKQVLHEQFKSDGKWISQTKIISKAVCHAQKIPFGHLNAS